MRFLVPLDESELALSIIPAVRRLLGPCLQADARLAGLLATLPGAETPTQPAPSAEVHLLTVLHAHGMPRGVNAGPADPSATEELRPEGGLREPGNEPARQEAVMRLSVIAQVHFPEVATQCHVLCSGRIAEAIVKAAEELNVDAIAMATHGRSGVGHLLTGSVADAVIRTSKRPVIVQRPPAMGANAVPDGGTAVRLRY